MYKTVKDNQKENDPNIGNAQNILADSIRRAREKFNKLQNFPTDRSISFQQKSLLYDLSNSKVQTKKQDRTALANAIKMLNLRLREMETQRQNHLKIIQNLKRQLRLKQQNIIKDNQKQIKLNKQNKILMEKINNKQIQINEVNLKLNDIFQQNNLLKVQLKNVQQKLITENNLSKNVFNSQINNKIKVLQEKEKLINQIQQQKYLSMIKNNETMTENIIIQKNLYEKIKQLTQNNEKNQQIIKKLSYQLQSEKTRNKVLLKSGIICDKNYDMNSKGQKEPPKKQVKKEKNNHEIQLGSKMQVKLLEDKNKSLFNQLKSTKNDLKFIKKQLNQWRQKFYHLKTLNTNIIDQIIKLPTNIQSIFKFLIVQVNKLQGFHLSSLRSISHSRSTKYYKKSEIGSNSKSKRNFKPLKMEDLNSSKYSINSRVKSINHSHDSSNHKSKSSVRLSSEKKRISKQNQIKTMKNMKQQIQEVKNKIKELQHNYTNIDKQNIENNQQQRQKFMKITNDLENLHNQKELLIEKIKILNQ